MGAKAAAPVPATVTTAKATKKPPVEKLSAADKSKSKPAKIPTKNASAVKAALPEEEIEPVVIDTTPPTNPKIVEQIRGLQNSREQRKDLAQPPTAKPMLTRDPRNVEPPPTPEKDRLILMVRDPFWLHACWDITRKSVERAKAALDGNWHTANRFFVS